MNERVNRLLYMALSLLLAIVLWLYVDDAQKNTISRDFPGVPIEFIGAEDTLPTSSSVSCRGSSSLRSSCSSVSVIRWRLSIPPR